MSFDFRWYQNEAIESLFDYFQTNDGNPVIALPTGTGKSLVIAGFIQRVLGYWPNQRFMILTHVKELVEQNAAELAALWPYAPIGIYSAGLKQKDIVQPIIFGGVGSVVNCVEAFGHRDLLIIDECHLLSPNDDSMYQNVIKRLKAINPYLKVIGLTATAFRLGQGMITDDGLFTDICYDLTGVDAFNRLIAEGYLSPLIPKPTKVEIDTSNVNLVNGDFAKGQLDLETEKVIFEALKEAIEYGYDRQSWLIFASGVKSADHAADILNGFGISAAAVHSKMPASERDARILAHKQGKYRAIVNNNVLTTGYNHKPIDFIPMLRPTVSPGLWVQMLGRGTRPSPETNKSNCLVLDFAGNTKRLGPINDPVKPKRKGASTGDVPIKICEACGVYNHAAARFCCYCGAEFKFRTKITSQAGTEELLKCEAPIVEYYDVTKVIYSKHDKTGSTPTLKVTYFCGLYKKFDEWVAIEHQGYSGKRARDWWRCRHSSEPPETVDNALQFVSQLRPPKRIRVWVNKRYPEVLSYEW